MGRHEVSNEWRHQKGCRCFGDSGGTGLDPASSAILDFATVIPTPGSQIHGEQVVITSYGTADSL